MDERTLSVEEVADWYSVVCATCVDGGFLEHLVDMRLRSDSHILLAEMLHMSVDVGTSQLLSERNLLQRHLVHTSAHRAEQRSCGEECALHDCGSYEKLSLSK